jgi:hypothetical protein
MAIICPREFVRDGRGGVAVEFVALLPAFLFLTFFVFEIFVAVLWVGTVEKAAQLGARLAVVSHTVVTNLPTDYALRSTAYAYGQPCSAGACGTTGQGFTTRTCAGGSGGDCNAAVCLGAAVSCFQVIVNRMRGIASFIQPNNVTISYEYVGLGFAGGPIIPRVSVTVQNVPYGLFMTTILNGFIRLATGNPTATLGMTNVPAITATYTGEDLSTAGAS